MKRPDLDQQLDAVATVANLFGLTDADMPATAAPDLVGWCQPSAGTVKGQHHRCIDCQPTRPGQGWAALVRSRLAATMPCTVCGRKLEDVR